MDSTTVENGFKYTPLGAKQLDEIWQKQKATIEHFISINHYDPKKIFVNEKLVLAVIAKVDQRKKYFEYFHSLEMSEFKEVALNAFWYTKLRPLCASSSSIVESDAQIFDAINEKFSLFLILSTIKEMLIKHNLSFERLDELSSSYISELIYSLKYRDISKESMILLVETIALFMGIDPYKENT